MIKIRHKNELVIALFVLSIFSALLYADTVHLENGNSMEGKISEETDEYVWLKVEGGRTKIYKTDIKSIDKSSFFLEPEEHKEEVHPIPENLKENPPIETNKEKSKKGFFVFLFVILLIALLLGGISFLLSLIGKKR